MERVDETLCTQGSDMLAYLYDEMPLADRDRFELHLADCGTCIDDFAELSQSRYPIYEWKQFEFDRLPTPRVDIPYGEATVSWFDRFRAAFAFNPAYAFGGIGAVLLAGFMTSYFLFSGSNVDEIAMDAQPSPSPLVASTIAPLPTTVDQATKSSATAPPSKPKVVSASMPTRTASKPVKTKATAPTPKKSNRVPVYSTTEDEEDDSLRLADIFAELDTSE